MKGGEPNPELRRDILRGPGAAPPKVQSTADAAEEAFAEAGAKLKAKEESP